MRDYQEIPQKTKVEYGLFLIRQIENFNADVLRSIRDLMHSEDLIISVERLFKGKKAALTIFGPQKILAQFMDRLNLLELEDYAERLGSENVFTWEIGVKDSRSLNLEELNIFKNLPEFHEEDQFFWQVILAPKGKHEDLFFQTQIRAAFLTKDTQRKKIFTPLLQNLNAGGLMKVPKPFSTEQMISFYRLRSLSQDTNGPRLTPDGVTRLLRI